METRRRTWFDDRGLVVAAGSRRIPFYAGAMHYWRVEPARWAACLRAMHGLGLTLVETYIPWRVHEPARGVYDWDGPNDVARFLETAQAAGLGVVIRPGPHVNAELTCFGMPDHVVGDPACQARTARGTPVWMPSPPRAWPVPSYASATFRARVREWYAAVAERVVPYLAPDGPIVACGIDNEAQMFFRLGAFDHDYHPDVVEWFAQASETGPGAPRSGGTEPGPNERANNNEQIDRSSGRLAEPPRAWDPADAERCVQWVAFKHRYLARALGEFGAMLDAVGIDVARFHNLPPTDHRLSDLRAIQDAIGGPVGIDAYTPRTGFRELRRRGLAMTATAVPLPIAFEVGVGFFPWFPPLEDLAGKDDALRERDHLLTLLAAGARGFNLFMTVERDRYYGAAIDRTGKVESHAKWIEPLLGALAEVDWPALRRRTPIALVATQADARFGLASSALDPMTPVVLEALGVAAGDLGSDAGAIAMRRWQDALADALELAQVPYVIVDEAATEAELAQYRAVIVPTLARVDRVLWGRLRALAESRQAIVVIGPGTPTHDELGKPLAEPAPRRAGRLKDGSLEDIPGLAGDLAELVDGHAWTIERPEHVRAFAFGDPVRVVFVANDAAKPASAVLLADHGAALRDPFTRERIAIEGGKATIAMHALGVRMLLVD